MAVDLSQFKIVDCEFSVRVSNAIVGWRGKDATLADVNFPREQLMKIKGLGSKGVKEILEMIEHVSTSPAEVLALERIERVTMFRTTDGKLFESSVEAARHEVRYNFIAWCRSELGYHAQIDEIAEKIAEHWDVTRKGAS